MQKYSSILISQEQKKTYILNAHLRTCLLVAARGEGRGEADRGRDTDSREEHGPAASHWRPNWGSAPTVRCTGRRCRPRRCPARARKIFCVSVEGTSADLKGPTSVKCWIKQPVCMEMKPFPLPFHSGIMPPVL